MCQIFQLAGIGKIHVVLNQAFYLGTVTQFTFMPDCQHLPDYIILDIPDIHYMMPSWLPDISDIGMYLHTLGIHDGATHAASQNLIICYIFVDRIV